MVRLHECIEIYIKNTVQPRQSVHLLAASAAPKGAASQVVVHDFSAVTLLLQQLQCNRYSGRSRLLLPTMQCTTVLLLLPVTDTTTVVVSLLPPAFITGCWQANNAA
jgi:hypothetical protein